MANVLLLEDNDRFANAVRRALTNHDVKRMESVDEAIRLLDSEEIDCALIDLNLTDHEDNSGAELLAYMLRNHPAIPRAVVTGSRLNGAIYQNMMQRYGVAEVVIKGDVEREGFGTRDLVDVVETLVQSSLSAERQSRITSLQATIAGADNKLEARLTVLDGARQFGLRGRGRAAGSVRARLLRARELLRELSDQAVLELSQCPLAELDRVTAELEAEVARVAVE